MDKGYLSNVYNVVYGVSDGFSLCEKTSALMSCHKKDAEKGQNVTHPKKEKGIH